MPPISLPAPAMQSAALARTPEEYLAFIKRRYDLMQKACIKLADLLRQIFPTSKFAADEFSLSLFSFFSLDISEQIEFLESQTATVPEAQVAAQRDRMEKDLVDITEQIEAQETQVQTIREKMQGAPKELQANIELGLMFFEQQKSELLKRRSFIQQMLEAEDKAE